jgi:hypothetical protein
MSICAKSTLNEMNLSHLHPLSMMNSFQNHPMAPSHAQQTPNQHHHQIQNSSDSSSDPNDPNPELILALIARNKSLEGKFITYIKLKYNDDLKI